MTEQRPSNQGVHPRFAKGSAKFHAQHPHNDKPFVAAFTEHTLLTLHECDLDVHQARQLRDWLNEVLP